MGAVRLHPIDDVLRAQTVRVARRLMQHRVGNDDIHIDIQQVVEQLRDRQRNQRPRINDKEFKVTRHVSETSMRGRV